jgi:GTP-binding protein
VTTDSNAPAIKAPPPNPFVAARFLISGARMEQLPRDEIPEAAFVGRSNAGKSSALNMICQKRALARVSKTPGRTQLLNLFDIGDTARLVDLPGYGFAQVPIATRNAWGELVGGFIERRLNLRGLVVVMDVRHPLTDLDWQMLDWCRSRALAGHVLLTKADKLGYGAGQNVLLKVRRELADFDPEMTVQLFSAHAGTGVDAVRGTVAGWLGLPFTPTELQKPSST